MLSTIAHLDFIVIRFFNTHIFADFRIFTRYSIFIVEEQLFSVFSFVLG